MTFRLHIRAVPDPQALPRILGYFAQRWVTPSALRMTAQDDSLHVELEISEIDERAAGIIVAKLRESVLVIDVALERAPAMHRTDRAMHVLRNGNEAYASAASA